MNYLKDKSRVRIIVTCEHGGNKVPERFRELFRGRERLLNSHRGYDRYALSLAGTIAEKLKAPIFHSTVTRLIIDLNRSPHHAGLFSKISGQLDYAEKQYVTARYYLPYRRKVESCVSESASKGIRILHISVHSFAPVMEGERKNADIGLLYDPSRYTEKNICRQWQKLIKETCPSLNVRRNYPYLGKADGHVTWFRKRFPPDIYAGIELEVNQKIMRRKKQPDMICDTLVSGLNSVISLFTEL